MKKEYLKIASELLNLAAGRFSNHWCNDFYIEDTPNNRIVYKEMWLEEKGVQVESIPVTSQGKIFCQDNIFMRFLAKKIKEN